MFNITWIFCCNKKSVLFLNLFKSYSRIILTSVNVLIFYKSLNLFLWELRVFILFVPECLWVSFFLLIIIGFTRLVAILHKILAVHIVDFHVTIILQNCIIETQYMYCKVIKIYRFCKLHYSCTFVAIINYIGSIFISHYVFYL